MSRNKKPDVYQQMRIDRYEAEIRTLLIAGKRSQSVTEQCVSLLLIELELLAHPREELGIDHLPIHVLIEIQHKCTDAFALGQPEYRLAASFAIVAFDLRKQAGFVAVGMFNVADRVYQRDLPADWARPLPGFRRRHILCSAYSG